MSGRINLAAMLEQVWNHQPDMVGLENVVVKELIHYEILSSLDRHGILSGLAFHGGTALRLCYGASRLSEDLDFAGGPGFTRQDVAGISEVVRSHLVSRYGLEVSLKEPKPRKKEIGGVAVDTWQITVVTNPEHLHLPRQRIKIDIATMVSRSTELQAIRKNYQVLPSGLEGLLVPVMSIQEILTNKLVSLPASAYRNHIRYRDIWDIAWLSLEGVSIKPEWLTGRMSEFGIVDYGERVAAIQKILDEPVTIERFKEEMARFLPEEIMGRTFDRTGADAFMFKMVQDSLARAAEIQGSKNTANRNTVPEDKKQNKVPHSGPRP